MYQSASSYVYEFYNLNILSNVTWFIKFTFTFTRLPNKSFITSSFFNQFFAFTFTLIFIPTLLLQTLASNLHLHLQVWFHFIRRVSLVLDTRLNTLIFMFLTTSEQAVQCVPCICLLIAYQQDQRPKYCL